MKPNPKTMPWTSMKSATFNRLEPSLTIHLSILSINLRSLGASPLTSPDSSILVRGVDRGRSDMSENEDPEVSDLAKGFSI